MRSKMIGYGEERVGRVGNLFFHYNRNESVLKF